jgi:hypothetical protein
MIQRLGFFLAFVIAPLLMHAQQSAQVLAGILEEKGILTRADRARISSAAPEDAVQMIASILRDKGLLSGAEVARVGGTHTTTVAVAQPAPPPEPPKGPAISAPPITSQSKLPVTVYGTVLLNAFSNTSLNNNQDVPLFAGKQGTDPTGGDKNFGMTARQSRFGLRYNGARVGDANISGVFEFDLFGGPASLPNGVGFDLFRTRLAYGRIDWKNFSLVAGQDWSVFAPLNPTSLAGYAIPDISASGNLWIRAAQIRAEMRHDFSDSSHLLFQIAATDPNAGDNPATLAEARTAGIGERGRFPGADSRLGWSDGSLSLGLSAHYGHGKNAGTIGTANVQRSVDSWGVAVDYTIPMTKYFNLTGEAYIGRALGLFSSAIGESVNAVGTPGEHGVESRGGWIQAQANWTKKWQSNVAYGIDSINAHQLAVGSRNKTQTYMTNVMYKWSPNVTFALEYKRFLTNFRNQLLYDELGDHINLAIAFTF